MSAARKPLDPDCNASVTCPVEGHVSVRLSRERNQQITWKHIPLTDGQRKTHRERQERKRQERDG